MRSLNTRLAVSGLLAGIAVLASSCSERGDRIPDTGASLEGTVTYGGVKVPFARITVMSEKGMATGRVQEDGQYKIANAPLGEVTIAVNTTAAKGDYQSKVMAESKGKGRSSLKFVDVPAKYHDVEKSGIKTTIQRGVNPYNIVIPK